MRRSAEAGAGVAQQEDDSASAWVPAPMKRLTKLLTSCSSPSPRTGSHLGTPLARESRQATAATAAVPSTLHCPPPGCCVHDGAGCTADMPAMRTQDVSTGIQQCSVRAVCTAPTCQLRTLCCWGAAKTPVGSLGAASSVSSTCGMVLDDASESSGQVAEQVRSTSGIQTPSAGGLLALMQQAAILWATCTGRKPAHRLHHWKVPAL